MKCEICGKEYKGRIGIGVHLRKGHSLEERQGLLMEHLLCLLPTILGVVILLGATRYIKEGKKL